MKTKSTVLWMVNLLLISRIVFVLLAMGFALILWQRNTHNLVQSVEKLSAENPNIDMLERGITTLYQAENNFRFYSATYDRGYFEAYSENLNTVSAIIDSLQKSLDYEGDVTKIGVSLNQKADISNIVIRLKILTDSLLTVAGQWDTSTLSKPNVPVFDIRKIQNLQKKSSIDSIIDTGTVQKKGFFKKVKGLFKDDITPQKKGIIVKHSEESKDTIIETNVKATPEYALLQDIHTYYSQKIKSYSDGRNQLNANEKTLASINTRLIEDIASILQQVKKSELESTKAIKDEAIHTGEKAARSISTIAAIAVLIAAVFFFLVFYYLRKIKESSTKLESEKQKAENLALQKSRFLSGMSHEIRAPLNNILGFTEQLKNTPEENREMYLSVISKSAEKMLSTVNQILDITKLEAGKMQFEDGTFSFYKVIESAAGSMVHAAREKKLLLNLHLPQQEDVPVSGDEFRLRQVVTNLIDNAIKYTEKGEINITADIKASGEDYKVFIEIADTGIGIPEDKINAVFNEFERLGNDEERRWKPGTGLGLTITRKIIEQQGGKIYVKENTKPGTVFSIELPFKKPQQKLTVTAKQGLFHKIPPGKTILLADDDVNCVMLVKIICGKYNINVISAENGQKAMEIVVRSGIDLIITDINMPVLSGLNFTRKLRANPAIASIPVIALTANVMTDEVQEMIDAGISEILFKPFREKEIIEKISLFLQ